jgi:hypothetical protein
MVERSPTRYDLNEGDEVKKVLLLIASLALAVGLLGGSANASTDAASAAQAAQFLQKANAANAPTPNRALHPPGVKAHSAKSMKGLSKKRIAAVGKRLLAEKRTQAFRSPFKTQASTARASTAKSGEVCYWYYFGSGYWGCFWYGGYVYPADWWYVFMYYEGYGFYGEYWIYWNWSWPYYYWYGPYYY